MRESGWLAHPVRLEGEPHGDITVESFKDFFNSIHDHYCAHFQTRQFQELFGKKLETITALKHALAEKAAKVNSEKEVCEGLKTEIDAKLAEVTANEQKIKEQLCRIQRKVKDFTCPYPNDYVL